MGLETGTTIADFRPEWPEGSDPKYEGDNHLKLIKSILQTQFPGKDLGGLNIPIIANEQELNWSHGLKDNIQDQIDYINTTGTGLAGQLAALQQQVDAMIPLKIVGSFHGSTMQIITGTGWSVLKQSTGAFEVTMNVPANGGYVVTASATAFSAVDIIDNYRFIIATTIAGAEPIDADSISFMVVDV